MSQEIADRFMAAIRDERAATSRRALLGKSALIGGGGALALTAVPALRASAQSDSLEADPYFEDDGIAILNYALTLEHLEATFYREALDMFTADDFDGGQVVYDLISQIGDHEAAHVDALTSTINDLGGTPVEEASYDFGYTDADSFLAVAVALENVGVSAYAGAAPSVAVLAPSLVATALGIYSVEARHASYVASLLDDPDISPFPDAVDAPRTPDEVLAIAGPFIVSSDNSTPAATPAASESEATVKMYDYGFDPAELEIPAGTTVTWTNTGQMTHNASADDGSFQTKFLSNGGSASVTFDEPGTFPYVCTLHAGLMQAVVVVT